MTRSSALIIDDHAELTDNLVEILSAAFPGQLECTVARSASEGLGLAETDLDLALVDLHLPDGDGSSLIGPLQERAPHAQVVVITGDATIESAIGAMERGAFGYVLKPFKAHDLVETASRALERARLLRDHELLRVELARSEERHRSVIESVPALVLALDRSGRILVWNRRLEDTTGRRREEMIGRPGRALIGSGGVDLRLPTASGGHRLVRWQLSEVAARSAEDPVTFAVGIDVTEEREAQRRAMRAERLAAVGTLAAGLAHEVRNPLNSASLQLQVLKRRIQRGETTPEALSAVVDVVDSEIRRLDHLVNDFLAFARPTPLDLRPTDLNRLVAAVVDLLRPECAAAAVEVELSLDPRVGTVLADQDRLRQVLLNVIRNALEAVVSHGMVCVRTLPADPRGEVTIVIEDDGPGFPEDAPIFDAFYTTKEQGTGLGLSIVHRIVTEHGGSIGVESRPGLTRFSIRLPQPASEPSDAAQ
jgi:signal transduction histidine kinase